MATEYTIINPLTLLGLGLAFSYFILYKRNRFIGNIGYISTAAIYLGMLDTTSATYDMQNGIGIFILTATIIMTIYDLIWRK